MGVCIEGRRLWQTGKRTNLLEQCSSLMGTNFREQVGINLYRLQEECLKAVLEELPLRLRDSGGGSFSPSYRQS